jgi:hypothetical protein
MLKSLHVKISKEAFELLEKMHGISDVPKSKIVERALRLVAKEYDDVRKGLALLRDLEEAEKDLSEGRARSWEDIKAELDGKKKQKRRAA